MRHVGETKRDKEERERIKSLHLYDCVQDVNDR